MWKKEETGNPEDSSGAKESASMRLREHFLNPVKLAEYFGQIKEYYLFPQYSQLERVYDWANGDLPDNRDITQWILFFEFLSLEDDIHGTNSLDECWLKAESGVQKRALRWYLSKVRPLCNYSWNNTLPSDDYRFYLNLEKECGDLVVLYPFVFLKEDVPFLFDKKIYPPGCAHPLAFRLNADEKSVARNRYADPVDFENFEKAIQNDNPANTVYEFKDGIWYGRIPENIQSRRVWSTREVMGLKSTDDLTSLSLDAIKKMIEIGSRESSGRVLPTDETLNSSGYPEHYLSEQNYSGCGNIAGSTGKGNDAGVLDQNPAQNSMPRVNTTRKNRPTIAESDISSTYYKKYEMIRQAGNRSQVEGMDLLNPDTNNIFPDKPLPKENECAYIGSGVTQKIIGSGGMGVVYLTWVKELELFRALKLLRPADAIDPEQYFRYQKRFLREIKVQSSMYHTNIAQIHTFGVWNKYLFFEMEYVKGLDVKKYWIGPEESLRSSPRHLSSRRFKASTMRIIKCCA